MRLSTSMGVLAGLLLLAPAAHAAKTCKDGVSPRSSGCPLEFTEQLIAYDDFDAGADGWSRPAVSAASCGPDPMLVLAAAAGSASSKVYSGLPAHSHVRVQATVSFIDDWQQETAAIQLDGAFIWTEQHDEAAIPRGVDVCGSSTYSDSRIGVPVDITVPHTAASLTLGIMTTLPGVADAAMALDDVRVSVFSYEP